MPIAPDWRTIQLVVFGICLAFGSLVAGLTELPHLTRIRDALDVEHLLGVPVLAAVPEAIGAAEERRRVILRVVRAGVAVVAVTGAVPLLAFVWIRSGALQALARRFGG